MKNHPLFRLVGLIALFALCAGLSTGCMDNRSRGRGERPVNVGDNTDSPDAGDLTDASEPGPGPLPGGQNNPIPPGDDCGGCPSDQICSNGSCQPLPSGCPCPQGSYCNLSENRCVAGCLADTDCGSGHVCDTDARQCISGCTSNAECGSNQVCQIATRECVPRCTSNSECAFNQICTTDAYCAYGIPCGILHLCLDDCRGDASCEAECDRLAPQDAKNKRAPLLLCIEESQCGSADQECQYRACTSEFDICFDGYVGCNQFLACYFECSNDQCVSICATYTRSSSLEIYNEMIECANSVGCQTFACVEERCPAQWNTCLADR